MTLGTPVGIFVPFGHHVYFPSNVIELFDEKTKIVKRRVNMGTSFVIEKYEDQNRFRP